MPRESLFSLSSANNSEEDHYRVDSEKAIYEPLYELLGLHPLVTNFEYRVTNGSSGKDVNLSNEHFSEFLKSTKLKNGFVLTALEFGKLNGQMREIKQMTQELTLLIGKEIAQ